MYIYLHFASDTYFTITLLAAQVSRTTWCPDELIGERATQQQCSRRGRIAGISWMLNKSKTCEQFPVESNLNQLKTTNKASNFAQRDPQSQFHIKKRK